MSAGLCNGSRGTVFGFSFPPDDTPVVWVTFPAYRGPAILSQAGCDTVVPLCYTQFTDDSASSSTFRHQIPLKLAFSMTVYKAQGSSISKFIFVPGIGEVGFGMSYVALSRSTTAESFMIRGVQLPIWPRFSKMSTGEGKKFITSAELEFARQYVENTLPFLESLE